jgi:hypothetical protein
MAVKGKWAQGITPRNFKWIIKGRLAVCERPGGYGESHRKVRRQEEIIWVREQGFDFVVSLIPSPFNLHNYDELGVAWKHWPFTGDEESHRHLIDRYTSIRELLGTGAKVLMHAEELGDQVQGLCAGYLLWSDLLESGPQAISVSEKLVGRQLGPEGRAIVSLTAKITGKPEIEG